MYYEYVIIYIRRLTIKSFAIILTQLLKINTDTILKINWNISSKIHPKSEKLIFSEKLF